MKTTETPHELPQTPEAIQDELFRMPDHSERLDTQYQYSILNDPELRTRYVRYTENLIARLIADKIQHVVFLDKSARPVAWLVKSLWPTLGVDEEAKAVSLPEIRFANIDREQWGPVTGRSEDKNGGVDLSRIHPDAIHDLQRLFGGLSSDGHDIGSTRTQFDGATVAIVDEVKASGDTLEIATGLFELAFPEGRFKGLYWMPPVVKTRPGGARVNSEVPVWYNDYDQHGRLVADRNLKRSLASHSIRQQIGAMYLSTTFPYKDDQGELLRNEMQQLASEVADGLIPVTPSAERSDTTIDYIFNRVNNLTEEEFVTLKRDAETQNLPFAKVVIEYKIQRAKDRHPSSRA